MALTSLNFVWIVVTLLTDYKAAFYRKATMYRKQVDRARADQRAKDIRTDGSLSSMTHSMKLINSDGFGD